MKGTSKLRSRHLSDDRPLQRLRGCFLGDNAAVPPAYRVKVQKCASFVDILDVCKFTTFCDRNALRTRMRARTTPPPPPPPSRPLRTCTRACYGVVPVKSPTIYRRNLRREKNDRLVSVHTSISAEACSGKEIAGLLKKMMMMMMMMKNMMTRKSRNCI